MKLIKARARAHYGATNEWISNQLQEELDLIMDELLSEYETNWSKSATLLWMNYWVDLLYSLNGFMSLDTNTNHAEYRWVLSYVMRAEIME